MLIRKNTKAFKTILQIFTDCQDRSDREQLIRLFITKAGNTIHNRISVESIEGDAALFYEMNYQTVLNNLNSSNHQLNVSDDEPGLYFFHSSSNKVWDETPFEFDEAVKKEFASLPDLPAVRRRQKAGKFTLPSAPVKRESPKVTRKEKKTSAKVPEAGKTSPKQPDFRLSRDITFTNAGKLIFRQAKTTKGDVLEYYNKVADYVLPYLKDRPLMTRLQSDPGGKFVDLTVKTLVDDQEDLLPAWVKTAKGVKEKQEHLLCSDKEHLLLFVELGCLEFMPAAARLKQSDSPDHMIVGIDSPESEPGPAVDVALITRDILNGLDLPAFVKTDGASGFHVFVPLDGKSDFATVRDSAEVICKLVRLKVPDMVIMKESPYVYGKVTLDYTLNEKGQGILAPYSLVAGDIPVISTPLAWDEVKHSLRPEEINIDTIYKRLRQEDPFAKLTRKKVNAHSLLERLNTHYAFLL